jgi:hypothetical protein
MKKILSIILVMAIMCTICVPAFASQITEDTAQSHNTTVKYGLDSSYIVVIPDSVVIDTNSHEGEGTVTVTDILLPSETTLDVILNGSCNANNEFHLKDVDNAENKLAYKIFNEDDQSLKDKDVIISVIAGDVAGASEKLKFALVGDVTVAGKYSDILTFTVNCTVESPEPDLPDDPINPGIEPPVRAQMCMECGRKEFAHNLCDDFLCSDCCDVCDITPTYTILQCPGCLERYTADEFCPVCGNQCKNCCECECDACNEVGPICEQCWECENCCDCFNRSSLR